MSSYDNDEYDMSDLSPNRKKKKSKKHIDLLDSVRNMEDDNYVTSSGYSASSFLPSSMLKPQKKENKKEKEEKKDWVDGYDPDAWFDDMLTIQSIRPDKSKSRNSIFEDGSISGKRKKKKKKNEKGVELVDYKKELEPEMALFKNLLIDQNRFVESLQKEYDQITSSKSTARGISKQLTDMIKNITEARALSMQLVEKNVNAKKTIADLTIKQRKELAGELESGINMSDAGSSFMKQLLSERNQMFSEGDPADVSDFSEEDMLSSLDEIDLGDEDRSEETEKYLKYENQNVKISVIITDNDVENYQFVAMDEDGEIIEDYPLPEKTGLSINRSTNIATDTYGEKYVIIWE